MQIPWSVLFHRISSNSTAEFHKTKYIKDVKMHWIGSSVTITTTIRHVKYLASSNPHAKGQKTGRQGQWCILCCCISILLTLAPHVQSVISFGHSWNPSGFFGNFSGRVLHCKGILPHSFLWDTTAFAVIWHLQCFLVQASSLAAFLRAIIGM